MSIVFLILGFVLLVVGGEFLVRSSVAMSFKLNISKIVIGMTVVSFATSAPELLVSLQAALKGSPAIAINNVVGSNIANIGLVLGITAIVGAIAIDKSFYRMTWPIMMLFSGALYYFLWNDNQLIAIEGMVLFTALLIFVVYLIKGQKPSADDLEEVDDTLAVVSNFKIIIWLLIGAAALYFGSEWLVKGATQIATNLGVSEAVIGVTMIAIGTSVPELAASVIAAAKKEKAISLGNLIGSNIFNIGSVLGLTSMIKTIPVTEPLILSRDIFWMLLFAAAILPLGLLPKRNEINKFKGFALVILYSVFIVLVFKG
ncbi:calcium/sodium antiporter [Olleya sp. YSTF-M6]|uniref:Calcium/sodium antiporter n=1 Tax=Olleya sediminilitoris TaxID=2795739 RepID=A0ABS1WPA9_9FLAO|nr:calcium/sodium antiporter [Olleya sediminilitoris]MBL7560945.1 calcium/sodium antiporter [Olleya sediminilitoris]